MGDQPSRESLREVKREYRARQQAAARAARGKPPPLPKEPRGRRPAAPTAGDDPYATARPLVTTLVGVGMVAAIALVVALVVMPGGPPARPAAGRVPVIAATSAPATTAPSADPFAGTKVDHWPAGAAGVAAPPAKAVGAFSTAQVRDAYARTERYLRAALLDRRVLYGRSLAPVRQAVDPRLRATPLTLANRFAPDVVAAHPTVRVNGDFRAAGVAKGRLEVAYRYVTVHAVRPKRGGPTELVVVRRTGRLSFVAAGLATVTPPWIVRATYISGHSRCGVGWRHEDRYLEVYLDREPAAPSTAGPGSPERVNLLDPRAKDPAGCFTDTSTL